ncbi:hypothetical protein C8J57DRAFT_1597407 [Mycena rebaudengoi]|nr:hypothetical protein C8J57DRAFT_1597407 [Mycena rebaudengoi]
MSSRLSSFRGPSTPSPASSSTTTNHPGARRPRRGCSSRRTTASCARRELRGMTETWDDLVLLDGLKAARSLVDARTDLDNALALVPDGEQSRTRVVGPKLTLMEKRIAELDGVTAKLQKQFRRVNAVVDGLDAHKAKGCQWASAEPLWVTWSLEKFGALRRGYLLPTCAYLLLAPNNRASALLTAYHRAPETHVRLVDVLRSHAVSFEDARAVLATWVEQTWIEDGGWEARWEDVCAVEIDRWDAR